MLSNLILALPQRKTRDGLLDDLPAEAQSGLLCWSYGLGHVLDFL